MALSEPREQGRNSSALQVCEGLGNAVLTGIAGGVHVAVVRQAGELPGFGWVFTVVSLTCLLAVMMSLRIGPVRDEVLT